MTTRGTVMKVALGAIALALLIGAAQARTITFTVEDKTYTAGGCVTFTDGEILVPATVCRDMLEGGLTWNDALNSVVFHAAPTRLTFVADRNRVLINGEETFLTHRPVLRGGKMFLPVGFICESVGATMARTSPTEVTLKLGVYPKITSPDERQPLTVKIAGTVSKPEVYRGLPTCDQLRVWATEVADMFAGEVTWDSELRAAILTIDKHKLVFYEDKKTGMLDGNAFELTRKPVMSKAKLLIPLDSVCEMLGRQYIQEGAWQLLIGTTVD